MATDVMAMVDDLMLQERWQDAVAFLEARPEAVQSDHRLSWTLGWAHFKLRNLETARGLLRTAAEMAPDEYAEHFALGTVCLELSEYAEAEKSLLRAMQIRDTTLARMTLAMAYMEQGRMQEAEQIHLDGLAAEPKSRDRWESYGDFLSDQGRDAEAEKAYAEAKLLVA